VNSTTSTKIGAWKSVVEAGRFVEPMLCLAVNKLPEGRAWQYELKLDGYRGIGVKAQGKGASLFT
jgi:ATP-dependent DNA ligase